MVMLDIPTKLVNCKFTLSTSVYSANALLLWVCFMFTISCHRACMGHRGNREQGDEDRMEDAGNGL